ncbi:MAG: helix-turn-helix transcriptional regulator [Steroidobacteraceae bacterium]
MKHLRNPQHRAPIATIVQARKAAGLTQRQLAIKLKRSNSFVWKIEAGERRVDLLEFIEIARCLGQDPLQMFSRLVR